MRVTRSFIPNMFTLANLFSGFSAIIFISKNHFETAVAFVVLAALFDLLDGLVARLVKATSELGAELDSLCDAVSFGVAPAYLLYQMYFNEFGQIGILISSLPALTGALRLARFNVMLVSFEDKDYFTGLPIPSAALTIISYLMFIHTNPEIDSNIKDILIYSVTIIVSLLMVSRIKFDNIPKLNRRTLRKRPIVTIIFYIGLLVIIFSKGQFLFYGMILYIVFTVIREVIIWFKHINEIEEDFDEGDEFDSREYDL